MHQGYLLGVFDMLNIADLDLIKQARERCDRLVVGVLDDSVAATVTGRSPVVPVEERAALVDSLRDVDEVVVHDPSAAPPGQPPERMLWFCDGIELEAVGHADVTVLSPARRTASPALTAALRSAPTTAVA